MVTYKCGHVAEVQLFGKMEDREKKIAWYATIDCPECQAEAKAEEAKAAGLPELTGSEKQIAWALSIRQKFVDEVEAIKTETLSKIREEKAEWFVSQADKAKQNHLQKTEAKYWIDNRFDLNNIDTTEWLKEVVEA